MSVCGWPVMLPSVPCRQFRREILDQVSKALHPEQHAQPTASLVVEVVLRVCRQVNKHGEIAN